MRPPCLGRRTLLRGGLALTAAGVAAFQLPAVRAQTAAAATGKPVRLVVPFPAGAVTDLTARLMAQHLQQTTGQIYIVDNKVGAGGSIGAMEVIRAAPDGHTLFFASSSALANNVALLKSIPYDPTKDFSPIAGIAATNLALMVRHDFPVKTVAEFIAYARQRPGKLSAGYGSASSQISIALLAKAAGLDVLSVPYKSIPLAANDVIGGVLDFAFVDLGNALAQDRGGKLRGIAVVSDQRSPLAPDWPAMAETLPGYEVLSWLALAGPPNMPAALVEANYQVFNGALNSPEIKQKLAGVGMAPMPMRPERLKALIAKEVTAWIKLARASNIEPQ